ncbi:MAG: histidine kinase [Prevotellaceae bacterium]|jgi:sensor histidine kinase YesM|nr:histidine kinase [Prevotellaceae bacterium]
MKRLANNLVLISVLLFIALSNIYQVSPDGMEQAGGVLTAEVILLTMAYFIAIIANIRVLVPRLLLHNKFVRYILSLLAFAATFTLMEIVFEYVLKDRYHITLGRYSYFSDNDNMLFFDLLSSVVSYSVSIAGSALIIFLHLWEQSGEKIREVGEQNAQSELIKVRTRIDSEALFNTLDKAISIIKQSPSEVVSLLMDLSRSLRIQLYESRYRHTTLHESPAQTFDLHSPAMHLLTDKRYRLLRHAMMITLFTAIILSNFDGSLSSLLFALLLPLPIFLALTYFNIYVLMPKLIMQGRVRAYLAAVMASVLVVVMPIQIHYFQETSVNGTSVWILALYTISYIIIISFPIIGINAIVLFQYWVRNQQHIAELETTTVLSELELLQNQVNPHFLFNMLNNIIVLTKKNPAQASDILHKLNDMLKYQFHSSAGQSIRLGDDIRFLTDYLNLEKLRRDNFEFSIYADSGVEEISLPSLLFIPFVENAVKHNNDNRILSFVQIRFTFENDKLRFVCVNSKPMRPIHNDEVGGLGLPNIRRRLDLLYGNSYHLEITENEICYTVQLDIDLKK